MFSEILLFVYLFFLVFVCLFKGTNNSGSHSNNLVDVSYAPQWWFPSYIKQEKEEESVSQRGDLLDFIDQDHYKSGKEVNQNPEHRTDNPIKREESGSPSTTTDKQVSVPLCFSRIHLLFKLCYQFGIDSLWFIFRSVKI